MRTIRLTWSVHVLFILQINCNVQNFIVIFVLLLISCKGQDHNNDKVYTQDVSQECKFCGSRFSTTNFTRTHIDGTLQRFKITANELILKRRKGRIIEFYDYEELFFKNLIVEQPLNTNIVRFDTTEINSLMKLNDDQTVNNLNTFDNQTKKNQPNTLGKKLNRITGNGIKINSKPYASKKDSIVLKANSAKILADSLTMQFEGNVTLDAKSCKLTSTIAIWSNTYNGLFFSEPFKFNNKTFNTPTFFQITDTGYCKIIKNIKNVDYVDNLDIIEEQMIASLPVTVQFLFGILSTPTSF